MDLLKQDFEKLSSNEKELANEALLLLHKYQKLDARYNALFQLNKLSNECTDLSSLYRQTHQIIASLMKAENFYIALYDPTFSTIEFSYHIDEKDVFPSGAIPIQDFEGGLTKYVIDTKRPLLATPQTINELSDSSHLKVVGAEGVDWLGVPLLNEGYVVGVMAVQSYSEDTRYTEQELELLMFTGQHVVSAMVRLQDHERLHQAVDARTRELMQQIRDREKSELLQESLFRISELTNDNSIEISEFYSQVHNIIGQMINASNFYIAKISSDSRLINFVYYVDQNSDDLSKDFQPRIMSNNLTELVIRKGDTLLLSREDIIDLHRKGVISTPHKATTTWLGVPLIHSGVVLGVMVIQSYQSKLVYTEQDAELLNFVSDHIASAIKRRELLAFERQTHEILEQQVRLRTLALEEEISQRKLAEQQLTHAASHDNLTGLANRVVFIDLLNHAIASSKRFPERLFAVLFLDLDRFKVVNDSLGHHAGDILLKIVAKELLALVRNKDTVARFGGDEFVILIEDLESKQEAYDIAKRITEFLSTPFIIEDHPVYIGTSIGVLFNNERYDNADIMLRDADTAMYHAKEKGRGRYEVFDSSMHSTVQNALTLEADIREAIEAKEFIPYYQPIVKLGDDKVIGFEALARWESKKRGFVFPNDFIPLAEDRNLVMPIDFQILEKACIQLKSWQTQYGCDDLYISCNLYCDHFFSLSLAEDISTILERVGVSPKNLRIELTERALLDNSDIVLQNMKSLKNLGVKILLDDFGTGYSSLSYLHLFPIDVLKIDRSFITNVHDHESHQAIIKTIIDLATNLDMATVGEGIESLKDAQVLRSMDCEFGQGYYFSKPLQPDDAQKLLADL
jgi:diguanylate cyclase (GGDEF)-like protein